MSETNNTKQAAWIAIGSLFSFGFGIVSSMILSRYFDKGDYGTYKQVMYVYNTLLTVFTLGLPKAFSFFLPRVDKSQAKNLIKKITNLFFILGAIFSLILFAFSHQFASLLKNPDLDYAIKIFSLVPFLMLPTMGLEGVLATYKQTMFMTIYTIVTRTMMLLCVACPVMFLDCGYTEALIGFVVASFVSFILALYLQYYPVRQEQNLKCNVTYREIFSFSLPLLYASIWGTVIASSDQFFISRYFGNEIFAEFSNGFIELPFVGMILGACATVLSPLFSKLSYKTINPKDDIYPIWITVFKKTAMLIYPLVLYCLFFADIVMVVLYGSLYEISDSYFRIRLISNFFTLISYGPLIINIGKVKAYANVHMYSAIILVVAEYISVATIAEPHAVAVISLICHLGRIFFMLKIVSKYMNIKFYELFPLRIILKIIIPSVFILAAERYFFVTVLSLNEILSLIISFICYIIIYMIYARFAKMNYYSIIKPLFRK